MNKIKKNEIFFFIFLAISKKRHHYILAFWPGGEGGYQTSASGIEPKACQSTLIGQVNSSFWVARWTGLKNHSNKYFEICQKGKSPCAFYKSLNRRKKGWKKVNRRNWQLCKKVHIFLCKLLEYFQIMELPPSPCTFGLHVTQCQPLQAIFWTYF